MDSASSPLERTKEHFSSLHAPTEEFQLTVRQPEKIQSLLAVLSDLRKITERVSEDHSHDVGGGGTSAGATGGDDGASPIVSMRQQAIRSLPATSIMQRRLTHHLEREVRQLQHEARRMARSARMGSAYLLTRIYARIRKVQTLIADILEAAAEVIERLYIRLFIDHQQLL